MSRAKQRLQDELVEIKAAGLYKSERIIESQQSAEIHVGGDVVLNFCANNYLGLANHPVLIKAAQDGLDKWGFGLSSVRFICGTQSIHKQLEHKIADFLGMEDAILYSSCFDANGGLFETILGPEDAIISDQLNHASIIDGIRLCKAKRYRYANNDIKALEEILKESQDARTRLISTDGVFSMDGYIAQIDKICDLADKYDALVHVDDSHATGFLGPNGRGSYEFRGAMGRVDIITSTLGKAMGGASGGFTAAHQEIVDMLRQRSRPYLFSNTLAPAITAASIAVLDLLSEASDLREALIENTNYFRSQMTSAGFDIKQGEHPIVPIMLGDAKLAQDVAAEMLAKGIYVIGFSFPVVPKDEARIRVQISAAHTREHLDKAIQAFIDVGKQFGVI